MTPDDKLKMLLCRATKAAEKARQRALKLRLRKKFNQRAEETLRVAEDYAHRLAERRRYRALLEDRSLDAERFRWYFSRFGNDLDSARVWIDQRMQASEKSNAAS